MPSTPVNNRDAEVEQCAPTKPLESTSFRPLGPAIETPLPMQRLNDSRDYSPQEPNFTPETNNGGRDENENESDNTATESEEDRQRREEEESLALARALMAEEAMAVSYHMSVDYLRNNQDQFSEEDLAALQAAMEEDEVVDEELEEAVEADNSMSYELMLRLGERLGDVKSERWSRIAREKIDQQPTFKFDPEAVKGMDENDCNVKCLVCQFAYEKDETLRRMTRCNHCFHKDCIDQWLMSKDFCPYCRKSIVEDEAEK